MCSDVSNAIKIHHLSKLYHLYEQPKDRFKQMILPRLRRKLGLPHKDFFTCHQALHDVNLEVKRGETLGIIGHNGAGKSTLLQIICGTLSATEGQVETNGRIAALLELGAGFNGEFSGRENIYLYGAILGLEASTIDERFDEICEFADIGDYLDQPVKTYSSGMYVRLAFAVSACIDPDILIIDEALAVGDVKFQAKCFRRFEELVARGTTILFVTHSTEQIVRHCDRAVLLKGGRIMFDGPPKDVANLYLDMMFGVDRNQKNEAAISEKAIHDNDATLLSQQFEERPGYNPHEYRWGNQEARILDFHVSQNHSEHITSLEAGLPITLRISTSFETTVHNPIYGLTLKTPDGITVYSCNSRDQHLGPLYSIVNAGETKQVTFKLKNNLGAGDYLISIGVAQEIDGDVIPLDRRYDSIHIQVTSRHKMVGLVDLEMEISN